MDSAIFIDLQLFYFLIRIIPDINLMFKTYMKSLLRMFIVFMANDALTAFSIYALKIKMREINIPPICTFHCILEEPLAN